MAIKNKGNLSKEGNLRETVCNPLSPYIQYNKSFIKLQEIISDKQKPFDRSHKQVANRVQSSVAHCLFLFRNLYQTNYQIPFATKGYL